MALFHSLRDLDTATLEGQPATMPAPLDRARRDLLKAAGTLGLDEVRFLVDLYYELQEHRIATANQVRSLEGTEEPDSLLVWARGSFAMVEKELQRGLDVFSATEPTGLGLWARSIMGIGPVMAAGLMAHIDIEQAPTVGHIWRFAGLDPTARWERGQKRPHNARLKVLCWKLGESFVKVSGNDRDVYGHLWAHRKLYEVERNEAGGNAETAAATLAAKKIGKDTEAFKAYSSGKLPAAQIHARAKRWAVKLFLAHYHEVAYWLRFQRLPPLPYVMTHLGHADMIGPPNLDLVPGLAEARRAAGLPTPR